MSGLNKDDVIRMAREAGINVTEGNSFSDDMYISVLYRFANIVTAVEREACAKLCDEKVSAEYATGKVDHNEIGWTHSCAIAIRARGQG